MRVHFKNAVEVAAAIRGLELERAKTYLQHVLEEKEAIPFNRFKGGRGRHAQAKNLKVPGSLVGWPKNAVKAIQSLLLNAESNAESKGLDTGEQHAQQSDDSGSAAAAACDGSSMRRDTATTTAAAACLYWQQQQQRAVGRARPARRPCRAPPATSGVRRRRGRSSRRCRRSSSSVCAAAPAHTGATRSSIR